MPITNQPTPLSHPLLSVPLGTLANQKTNGKSALLFIVNRFLAATDGSAPQQQRPQNTALGGLGGSVLFCHFSTSAAPENRSLGFCTSSKQGQQSDFSVELFLRHTRIFPRSWQEWFTGTEAGVLPVGSVSTDLKLK